MGKENLTKTLSALVAVSKTETGMDYVQVMPDNPRVGQVKPFHGRGYGQMLSNGTFDFVRIPKKHGKPVLKLQHSSVSYGADGYDRYVFTLPNEQRAEFAKLLKREVAKAIKFMDNQK
jgi:hypothetical protein